VRLVVDTGIHFYGWTRDQAIEYFKFNTGMGHHEIVREVDRYITYRGQALAYKIGELKIIEMRRSAELSLGEDFDVRTFHDEVLNLGPVPLSIFESQMKQWINRQL
jgi:uncharacterized protein (DUF885 family)